MFIVSFFVGVRFATCCVARCDDADGCDKLRWRSWRRYIIAKLRVFDMICKCGDEKNG